MTDEQEAPGSTAGRVGWACLAAAMLVLAGPKAGVWPLALVGLVPLFHVVRDRSGWGAFGWGWLVGFLANMGGQYWAPALLMRFGKMAWWTSPLVLAVVAGYQALAFGLFAWLVRVVGARTRIPATVLAAAAWVAVELAMPFFLPWSLALLIVPCWPLLQVAEVGGAAAVAFVLVLFNATAYAAIRSMTARERSTGLMPGSLEVRRAALALLLLIVLGTGRGLWVQHRASGAARARIGLVQPNFGIITRESRARETGRIVEVMRAATAEAIRKGAELVVWPESGWPMPVDRRLEQDYPAGHPWQLRRGMGQVPLLANVVGLTFTDSEHDAIYNSAWLLDGTGQAAGRYDKTILLAFGEYVPFGDRFPSWRRSVRARMSESDEFQRGDGPRVLSTGKLRLLPLICYEDIVGDYVRQGARLLPNLLVTQANVAWFGSSAAPEQHLRLSALRAVEHRTELVRATNTGMSAHVDALGRIRSRGTLEDPQPGQQIAPQVLMADVALLELGPTLYARLGDTFSYACCALVAIALFVSLFGWPAALSSTRRRRHRHS